MLCKDSTGNSKHIPALAAKDPTDEKDQEKKEEENPPPRVVVEYGRMKFTIVAKSTYFVFAVGWGTMFYVVLKD